MSQPRACERASGVSGFSLVEVMCALVIASMALVVLLRGLGGSQSAAAFLEAHLGARLIAQSIIEDERLSGETTPGTRAGKSGQYAWRLSIEPVSVSGIGQIPTSHRLYRLSVEVQWQPRGRVVLDTLKLAKQR